MACICNGCEYKEELYLLKAKNTHKKDQFAGIISELDERLNDLSKEDQKFIRGE